MWTPGFIRPTGSWVQLQGPGQTMGGFRRFATWTVSLTCVSADIGFWLQLMKQ